MGYKVKRTDLFQNDLDNVIGYIVFSLKNRIAAASLLDAIEECYEDLEDMPYKYPPCQDSYLKSLGYRKLAVKNYIIVYEVDEETKTVFILRLFHGKQDYEKLI